MNDAWSPNTDIPPLAQNPARGWRRRAAVVATAGALAAGLAIAPAALAGAAEPAEATAVLPSAIERQKPVWSRCEADAPEDYQCATIKVPLDYQKPAGATLDLAISRIATSVPAKRHGIMLLNPGGPGGQGLGMPLMMKDELPPSVQEQYDLIGFDPRGVGQSSPITCGLTSEESGLLYPYKPQTFAKDVDRARTVARKCATQGGQEIAYITTRSTARDMDVIRAVLGEKKLSYLGYSYGTYLGAVYTQLFPKRADRIVLDSAVDPQLAWRGMIQSWSVGSQPAFVRWAEWTARHAAEFGLGATPAEVSKTFWDLVAQADKTPIDWDGVPMTGDDIRIGARRAVFSPREAATMIAALNKAAHGGAADPAQAARLRAFAATAEPADDNSISVFLAVVCNDVANWPRDPERYRRDAIRDKARYPLAGDVTSNIFPCAFWRVPRTERSSRVDNAVGALVVQNEWDSQTPVFSGLGMHRALKGSRLVFVDEGEGHGVYFKSGNACAYRAVSDYLDTGELPAKDVTCVADPESSRSLLPGATAPRLPGPF